MERVERRHETRVPLRLQICLRIAWLQCSCLDVSQDVKQQRERIYNHLTYACAFSSDTGLAEQTRAVHFLAARTACHRWSVRVVSPASSERDCGGKNGNSSKRVPETHVLAAKSMRNLPVVFAEHCDIGWESELTNRMRNGFYD